MRRTGQAIVLLAFMASFTVISSGSASAESGYGLSYSGRYDRLDTRPGVTDQGVLSCTVVANPFYDGPAEPDNLFVATETTVEECFLVGGASAPTPITFTGEVAATAITGGRGTGQLCVLGSAIYVNVVDPLRSMEIAPTLSC